MQGPINKEPDDKLDPSNKPTGIRKLYVLDSNNFLIVVIDIKLDDLFFSIINFIISNKIPVNPAISVHETAIVAASTSEKSLSMSNPFSSINANSNFCEYVDKKNLNESGSNNDSLSRNCPARRYISSRSCDCIIEKNINTLNTTTASIVNSSTFSLTFVFVLNLFYLLICFKTNSILTWCFMFVLNVVMCKNLVFFALILSLSHFVLTKFKVKVKLKNKKRIKARVALSKKKKYMTF